MLLGESSKSENIKMFVIVFRQHSHFWNFPLNCLFTPLISDKSMYFCKTLCLHTRIDSRSGESFVSAPLLDHASITCRPPPTGWTIGWSFYGSVFMLNMCNTMTTPGLMCKARKRDELCVQRHSKHPCRDLTGLEFMFH